MQNMWHPTPFLPYTPSNSKSAVLWEQQEAKCETFETWCYIHCINPSNSHNQIFQFYWEFYSDLISQEGASVEYRAKSSNWVMTVYMYIDFIPTKCSKVTFHLMGTSSKILLQIVMVSESYNHESQSRTNESQLKKKKKGPNWKCLSQTVNMKTDYKTLYYSILTLNYRPSILKHNKG